MKDIDCVVPVPDGSRPAAIQISAHLGLPYREGLVKNRYVGRTFIMPDQQCAPSRSIVGWDEQMTAALLARLAALVYLAPTHSSSQHSEVAWRRHALCCA